FSRWTRREGRMHLAEFPAEVLGCPLPWSLLLLGYGRRGLRNSLGAAGPLALFNGLALGFAFVSIWVPPNGQTRYLSPLYPCLAVLAGVAVECCLRAEVPQVVRTGWRLFSLLMAFVIAAAGLAAVVAVLFLAGHPKFGDWAEPHPLVAFAYAAACALLAALTWRGRRADDAGRTRAAVLAMACFMVLSFTGMLTNVRVRRTE